MEKELRELIPARPGFMPLVRDLDAPAAAGGEAIKDRGVVIAITKDGGIFTQGSRLENTDHVFDYVDTIYKQALEAHVMGGASSRDFRLRVYLWADRDAPASVVAQVAAAADIEHATPPKRKGPSPLDSLDDPLPPGDDPPPPEEEEPPPPHHKTASARDQARAQAKAAGILGKTSPDDAKREPHVIIRLLVAVDGARAPSPEPSGPGAKLPATEPESTKYLVDQLRSAIGACGPIIKTLGTLSLAGGPGPQAEALAKGLPAGLLACDCKVADADALEWGARVWLGAAAPPLASLALPNLDKTDKRHLGEALGH